MNFFNGFLDFVIDLVDKDENFVWGKIMVR